MRCLILVLILIQAASAATVNLVPGWNSVAFPHASLRTLEATGVAGLVAFDGTSYQPVSLSAVQTQRGYWAYSPSGGQLRYEDAGAPEPTSLTVRAGWNLVAFPLASNLTSNQLRGANVILYEAGATTPVDRVQPGRAYWLFADRAGQLEWSLPAAAADLYRKAQAGDWFAQADALHPTLVPTSDGRSFLVVWKPSAAPKQWIVSLHGTGGFATDDLALWHPYLEGRDIGLVCVQWWLGEGDVYYSPAQIYGEVDTVLKSLGVPPGQVMLHGFSRGSANSYALAAQDSGRWFSLCVASSGGVGLDFPPTKEIVPGALRPTRWVTAAGARDPNPDRDGIPGMRRTAEWLRQQGATVVDVIEDPVEGHGALMRNPANARRLLDLFQRR